MAEKFQGNPPTFCSHSVEPLTSVYQHRWNIKTLHQFW